MKAPQALAVEAEFDAIGGAFALIATAVRTGSVDALDRELNLAALTARSLTRSIH